MMSTDTESNTQTPESKITISDYQLRPFQEFEEWLVINGEFAGQWWEWVRKAWMKNRELTEKLLDEFYFAYLRYSNTIIVFKGTMGGGKSISALSVAKHLQTLIKEVLGLDVKIYVTFSNDETFRMVPKLQKGDILVQDEDSRQSGEGSATVRSAIFNVQETVRANQNCFIFCSPTLKGFQNACHVLLEPFGINYEHEITRVKVYSAYTERPLGWALIKKFKDPDLEAYYKERKKRFVESVIKSRGLSTVRYDIEPLRQDARKLIARVEEEFGPGDIEKEDLKMMISFSGIVGNISYQKDVVRYAHRLVREAKRQHNGMSSDNPTPALSLQGIEFNEGLFHAFIQGMQQFIATRLPYDSTRTKYNIAQECANIYPLYLAYHHLGKKKRIKKIQLDLENPLKDYGIHRRLHTLLDFLKNPDVYRQIGELYESVFCTYYRKRGADVHQGGGSIAGDFDALINDDVWSLKCYHDEKNQTIKIYFKDISRREKDLCQQNDSPLHISFLNPYWGTELSQQILIDDFQAQDFVRFSRPPVSSP